MSAAHTGYPEGAVPAIATLVLPDVANLHGGAFGGWITGQCDLAAGILGRRHGGACVTKSVQEMVFHAVLQVGDAFMIHGAIVREGRTSMTIELTGWRESEAGLREAVVTARFVMVCIDEQGRPRALGRN
ncbi:acyl-CoA thioesterase [Novosphingobium profundi]|uniref:acyl-CoA thioesterase n=1 Tax=Novosphingobium profundi TaxID=1774954 RepID=UPI001BDA3822|nr:hotdog domain-containing protein [Novosphingobium profundi]MBT0670753.1 acyl-CoA thioesterase [Novosphingobium profundi]